MWYLLLLKQQQNFTTLGYKKKKWYFSVLYNYTECLIKWGPYNPVKLV